MAHLTWSMVFPYVLALLAAGAVSGVIAGLLGVGGGIVLMPVLEWALSLSGVSADLSIKIAVATSLATIAPTAISASRAHRRRDTIDNAVIRAWVVPIVLGAFAGVLLTTRLHADVLRWVFVLVATLVALKMVLPLDNWVLSHSLPSGWRASWLPFSIGSISILMGIGGGSLSVTTMTLCNYPVQRAVGTARYLVYGLHCLSQWGFWW
ncbi:MAG: sulfite exporter TauE/SafE family protein [Steroidobacteraceae bacterium]